MEEGDEKEPCLAGLVRGEDEEEEEREDGPWICLLGSERKLIHFG